MIDVQGFGKECEMKTDQLCRQMRYAVLVVLLIFSSCATTIPPVVEMEVSPITDAMEPTLRTRLEALVETAYQCRTA